MSYGNLFKILIGGTAALSCATAAAVPLVLDLAGAGTFSCDSPGAPCNISLTIDLGNELGASGADVNINQVDWDLTISTVGASWLSEAVISFQYDAGDGFGVTEQATLTAGIADTFPGTMNYQGSADTSFLPTIQDGLLTLEFYESFDDAAGAIDAFYVEPSSLTLDVELVNALVPAPSTVALLSMGCLGLAVARRRRS